MIFWILSFFESRNGLFIFAVIPLLTLALGCEIPVGGGGAGLNSVSIPLISSQCSISTTNCPHVGDGNSRNLIIIYTTVASCEDDSSTNTSAVKARATGTWTCGPGVCTGQVGSFSPTAIQRRAYRVCAIIDLNENGIADVGDRAGYTSVDYASSEPHDLTISAEWDNY